VIGIPLRTGEELDRQLPEAISSKAVDYFNDVLMAENFVLRVEPKPLTAAIVAGLRPAAIRPYSIAVASDSPAKNFAGIFFTVPPGKKQPDPSGSTAGL
jgi:hypothetical protein